MSTGPYRSEASSFYKNKWGVAGPHRVRGLHKYDSDARRLAEELNAAYAQGQADAQRWIPVTEKLPNQGDKVIAGHTSGWVWDDIMFLDGAFRLRKNAETGGSAGYKQKDTKKPNGDPAGPDEWLWGGICSPTHWMPIPPRP